MSNVIVLSLKSINNSFKTQTQFGFDLCSMLFLNALTMMLKLDITLDQSQV